MRPSDPLRPRSPIRRLATALAEMFTLDVTWSAALVAGGDDDAIAADWAAVGGDMGRAIDEFAASHLRA